MPKITIDMDTTKSAFADLGYQNKYSESWFAGDLVPSGPKVDMRIERSVVGNYNIYNMKTCTGIDFRRCWHHIREDKTDMLSCVFPRSGHAILTLSGVCHVVNPGECAIVRSNAPYTVQHVPGSNGCHESMHIHVPASMFNPALIAGVQYGRSFPTMNGGLFIAERILDILFKEDAHVDPQTAEGLLGTLLNGMVRALGQMSAKPLTRISLSDRRLSEIRRYIDKHFSNPDLNAALVSQRCGISVRYLCHIMKEHHLSFSVMLWEKRLNASLQWLKSTDMSQYQLREIAYQAGFKSTAHFSRSFKQRYGITPSRHREHPEYLDTAHMIEEKETSPSRKRKSIRRARFAIATGSSDLAGCPDRNRESAGARSH